MQSLTKGLNPEDFQYKFERLKYSNILEMFNDPARKMMSSNMKVMIVEDDIFLSFVEEKIVTRMGYEVVGTATSGEEALNSIDQINPDVLLIDVQLSGTMDGIDTVEQLRNKQFSAPVIFISGSSEKALLDRANKLNYVEYLIKPIDISVLTGPMKKAEMLHIESSNAA